jgi:maltose O-acetyltransferase
MFNWIAKKIRNQFVKLENRTYRRKVDRLKKTFKHCGSDVTIKLPVCLEGIGDISVGNNVSINAFVHMWGHGHINIGNDCLIASHVSITSLTHDPNAGLYRSGNVAKAVNIGNNVWIGSHAVILPGISIGNNAIVGAGAVVNKDVPANAVVAGVPAKIIRINSIVTDHE